MGPAGILGGRESEGFVSITLTLPSVSPTVCGGDQRGRVWPRDHRASKRESIRPSPRPPQEQTHQGKGSTPDL